MIFIRIINHYFPPKHTDQDIFLMREKKISFLMMCMLHNYSNVRD